MDRNRSKRLREASVAEDVYEYVTVSQQGVVRWIQDQSDRFGMDYAVVGLLVEQLKGRFHWCTTAKKAGLDPTPYETEGEAIQAGLWALADQEDARRNF